MKKELFFESPAFFILRKKSPEEWAYNIVNKASMALLSMSYDTLPDSLIAESIKGEIEQEINNLFDEMNAESLEIDFFNGLEKIQKKARKLLKENIRGLVFD